jgi:general secretion pathway protein B
MSYILDALKKAERERHVARIPTLGTVHRVSASTPRPRRWPWIAAVVVLLNAMVLAWFLRPGSAPAVKESADAIATPASSARPGVSVQPARPAEQAVPVTPPATPPVAVAPPPPTEARPPRQSPPEPTAKRAETTPGASVAPPAGSRTEPRLPQAAEPPAPAARSVAPAEPAPTPTAPAPSVAAVPDTPATPPAAVSPTRPAPRAPGPLPGLGDMAPADREAIPKMALQFLVYSDLPAERLVFINNHKYLEGQSIDGKVVVEAITPDGVVLSYQGKRFILRQ